jgi:co-chaperonin GroES (HSP10)
MSFRPLNEYLQIRPDPLDEKIGSIIIPCVDRFHHQHDGVQTNGTIIAVGRGHLVEKGPRAGEFRACDFRPGDRVVYPRHQLVPVLPDGTHIVHQQHILGLIEEEKEGL